MDNIVMVDRETLCAVFNSLVQFADITEIKGYQSMNLFIGCMMAIEKMATQPAPAQNDGNEPGEPKVMRIGGNTPDGPEGMGAPPKAEK